MRSVLIKGRLCQGIAKGSPLDSPSGVITINSLACYNKSYGWLEWWHVTCWSQSVRLGWPCSRLTTKFQVVLILKGTNALYELWLSSYSPISPILMIYRAIPAIFIRSIVHCCAWGLPHSHGRKCWKGFYGAFALKKNFSSSCFIQLAFIISGWMLKNWVRYMWHYLTGNLLEF